MMSEQELYCRATAKYPQFSRPVTGAVSGDEEEGAQWREKAVALASVVVPFVPVRVCTAFATGFLRRPTGTAEDEHRSGRAADSRQLASPMPRMMPRTAVLILDVSGFTALSEDANQRLGSEGVERFSLAMSSFFAVMIELIAAHDGDVDCFAGDAVLVVFQDTGNVGISEAVHRALSCAKAVHVRLDGFRHEPEDPPLSLHSALAAGELTSVTCGGVATNRSEAFVLGTPLHEIAIALSLSKKSEIMLALSAVHHWTPPDSPDWTQQTLPTGHLVMSRAASRSRMLQRSRSVESPLGLVEQTAEPKPRRPAYTEAIGDKSKDEFVSAKMRQERLIDEVVSFMDDMETAECILSSGRSLALGDLDEMLQGGPPSPDNSTTGMPTHCLPDSMGLGDLLRFLPEFVRKKCLSGQHTLTTLMEHRSVTVLFIIADMQEHTSKYTDSAWLFDLQEMLGRSIDVVEAQMGGATRQITVDDKGLAMIFVFGLPGYRSERQCGPAIFAGRKVLDLMGAAGIRGTAGITSGMCFCGLVGDPNLRCEYAVMGDMVNTAARLAVAAAKQGDTLLCGETVKRYMERRSRSSMLATHRFILQPAGSIKLKGKAGEAEVFRPEVVPEAESYDMVAPDEAFVGREAEMTLLRHATSGRCCGSAVGGVLVVVEGAIGIGKSRLVRQLFAGEAQAEHEWMLMQIDSGNHSDFVVCERILQWWLELHGEPGAASMAILQGDLGLAGSLPDILCCRTAAIRDLHEGQKDKTAQLAQLYSDILWDILTSRPVVLVLEDIDHLDQKSLRVLIDIGWRLQQEGEAANQPAWRHTSAILCTARRSPLLYMSQVLGLGMDLRQEPLQSDCRAGVALLQLQPLADEEVAELARVSLGGNLALPVIDLVIARSNGLPLHALELCDWLCASGLVEGGELTAKAARADLAHLVPPGMHRIVQAQVDQLPLAPAVLLRCASVWGDHFHVGALLEMLPEGLMSGLEELEQTLQTLRDGNLIKHAGALECVHMIGGDAGPAWQFCNRSLQELVYSILPHKYRRALHRTAACVIKRQLASMDGAWHSRPFLRAYVEQLLLMARASHGSEEVRYAKMNMGDLQALAEVLDRLAGISKELGDYQDMMSCRRQLLSLLREQNELAGYGELALLQLESQQLHSTVWDMEQLRQCDPVSFGRILGPDSAQRLAEHSARRQELRALMSRLQESTRRLSAVV